MTREEKAIIYFKDLRKRFCEDYLLCIPQNTIAYKATMAEKEFYDTAIKALEQEQKWISVSERLPKIADVYRVTRYYPNNVMNPKYLVDACAFDGSNTWYNDNRINHDRAYVDNVIAWQENPEPYMPQESEE